MQELRKNDDAEDENVGNDFDEDPNEPDAENEELQEGLNFNVD